MTTPKPTSKRFSHFRKMFPDWGGEKFVVTSKPIDENVTIFNSELWNEALRRCDLVRGLLKENSPINGMFLVEICYLQFRFICELIALACLSAHGDIKEIKSEKIQNIYQADIIIKHLTKLNAKFYPCPIRRVGIDGPGKIRIEPIEDDLYLTKDDLIRLYHKSSAFLHVGSFGKLTDNEQNDYSRSEVELWLAKITTLLDDHVIPLVNSPYAIFNDVTRRTNGTMSLHESGVARITYDDK